jgi:hypothetical protein
MIRVIKEEPAKSVVKEVICRNCGVTLEYTPADILSKIETDYGGGRDKVNYIPCPRCMHHVNV